MNFNEEMDKIIAESDQMEDINRIRGGIAGGKEIIIFGAGNCGHAVYHFLVDKHIKISAFCDNMQTGVDKETELPIINTELLSRDKNKYFILICVADESVYKAIYDQLKTLGFEEDQCLCMMDYIEAVPISFLVENRQSYQAVFDMLEDEFSKKTYIERIRRAYTLSDLSGVMQPIEDQYFDEKVKLTEQEVFVDCGAYIGDTAMEFIKRVDGKYRGLYMFEAEESKAGQIRKNLNGSNYQLYSFGVWSENRKMSFRADGASFSKLSMEKNKNNIEIDVVSLDSIPFEEAPTYIKMDVEGAEKQALDGCKNIISKYCPKLAICIYHSREDLYELPLLMKKLNPAYKLYIRHYSDFYAETVCYAL